MPPRSDTVSRETQRWQARTAECGRRKCGCGDVSPGSGPQIIEYGWAADSRRNTCGGPRPAELVRRSSGARSHQFTVKRSPSTRVASADCLSATPRGRVRSRSRLTLMHGTRACWRSVTANAFPPDPYRCANARQLVALVGHGSLGCPGLAVSWRSWCGRCLNLRRRIWARRTRRLTLRFTWNHGPRGGLRRRPGFTWNNAPG